MQRKPESRSVPLAAYFLYTDKHKQEALTIWFFWCSLQQRITHSKIFKVVQNWVETVIQKANQTYGCECLELL